MRALQVGSCTSIFPLDAGGDSLWTLGLLLWFGGKGPAQLSTEKRVLVRFSDSHPMIFPCARNTGPGSDSGPHVSP